MHRTPIGGAEGRPSDQYVLAAWDGAAISFGRLPGNNEDWEEVRPFDADAAERIVRVIVHDGVPLVYPDLLSELVGPESPVGQSLLPPLFQAIRRSSTGPPSKTRLLYTEWRRLFGQVIGTQTQGLRELLERQGVRHGAPYREDPAAYLFALNTQIAFVAKAVAVPDSAEIFRGRASSESRLAEPVPGTDAGPWLRGTLKQHALWQHLFGNGGAAAYKARKGITTDANGLFFLNAESEPRDVHVGLRQYRVTKVSTDPREGTRHLVP